MFSFIIFRPTLVTSDNAISSYDVLQTTEAEDLSFEANNNFAEHDLDPDSLQVLLPSKAGYLLRPYVKLTGQIKGYFWSHACRGKWKSFMDNQKKMYPQNETGKIAISSE